MTMLRTTVEVLRSRAYLLMGVAGSCLLGAAVYGVLAPERYEAVAMLFVDANALELGTANVRLQGGISDLDLLRSERVALRVAENEHLVEEAALRPIVLSSIDSGHSPVDALAQYLHEHVTAVVEGDGGVVRLGVSLRDPSLAARVANAYAQAWGEVSLELRAAGVRSGVERAHQELAALRARLGEARAMTAGGRALADAGARADAQFAELSRIATQVASQPRNAGPAPWEGSKPGQVLPAEPVTVHFDAPMATDLNREASARSLPAHPVHLAASEAAVDPAAKTSSAEDEIRFAQQSLERAEDRLARLSTDAIGTPFPVHVLRAARVPEASSKLSLQNCALLGLGAGVLLAMIALLIAERLDRRVRHASDVARGLGVIVLGSISGTVASRSRVHAPARAPAAWPRLNQTGNAV